MNNIKNIELKGKFFVKKNIFTVMSKKLNKNIYLLLLTSQLNYYIQNNLNQNLLKNFNFFLGISSKKLNFFITLYTKLNFFTQIYFQLYPGILTSFLKKKKTFKKTNTARFLIYKHVRVFLILLNPKPITLILKNSLINLKLFFKIIKTPQLSKLYNPYIKKYVDDNMFNFSNLNYIILKKNTFYGQYKLKKLRRLKRKIQRKLIKKNQIFL